MHILHINDSLERGGAETLLVSTVQAFAEFHPHIKQSVVTLYDKGELRPEISQFADYYSLNFKLINPWPAIFKLWRIIKKTKVNVVHSHLLHSTFLARLALPKQVGLVSTYHSVFYEPSMVSYARKEKLFDKFTYNKRYYSIFVSNAVRDNITEAIGIKVNYKVLMNFASPNFKPVHEFNPEKSLRIVMVGNLHAIKNHEIVIKALGQLSQLPIQLDIYGEGNLRDYLLNLIQECKANVHLKGAKPMSSDILGQYDLYMMSSLHEGMPISLLEAMQTGLPSLLNDISMLRETAGKSAFFYDYNNLADLVKKIKLIYTNKNILLPLIQESLLQSEKFSSKAFVNDLLKIYQKVYPQH